MAGPSHRPGDDAKPSALEIIMDPDLNDLTDPGSYQYRTTEPDEIFYSNKLLTDDAIVKYNRLWQQFSDGQLHIKPVYGDGSRASQEVVVSQDYLASLDRDTLAATLIHYTLEQLVSKQQTYMLYSIVNRQRGEIQRLGAQRASAIPATPIHAATPSSAQSATPLTLRRQPVNRQAFSAQTPIATPAGKRPVVDEKATPRRSTIYPTIPIASSPVPSSSKSSKIPDPPTLTDGQDPQYQAWKRQIQYKLYTNSDHYPSEIAQFTYTLSRLGGYALAQMEAYLLAQGENTYLPMEDLYHQLDKWFLNPFEHISAKSDYNTLQYCISTNMRMFYNKFTRLANQARVSTEQRKGDLYEKLPGNMQTLLVHHRLDDSIDLDTFSQQALAVSLTLNKPPQSSKAFVPQRVRNRASPRSITPKDRMSPQSAAPPKLPSAAKDPTSAVTCYNCQQPGHIVKDCPHPRRLTENKAIEVDYMAQGSDDDYADDEEQSIDEQSGNERL